MARNEAVFGHVPPGGGPIKSNGATLTFSRTTPTALAATRPSSSRRLAASSITSSREAEGGTVFAGRHQEATPSLPTLEASRPLPHSHLGRAIRPTKSGQTMIHDAVAGNPLTHPVVDCPLESTVNGTSDVSSGGQP